ATSASAAPGAGSNPVTVYPALARRDAMTEPIRPRPMNPILVPSVIGQLRQHLLRDPEGLERGRRADVGGGLEQGLLDLGHRGPVGDRATDMDGELVRTVEGREHRQVEQRPGPAVQSGAAP